ncbi:erythromycin esterase family protein [Actinopolymorpha sp. B17G11]|uniref:erythromycin esterase family protein n=1 Tax=Actinopolymorpha sp. B17G11 TaxID=3160861 RepID=UPI0032E51380
MMITRRRVLMVAGGLAAAAAAPATARADSGSIEAWIAANAAGLDTVDPHAPLVDLRVLKSNVDGVRLVGLGEPAHNLAEITTLKHRVLRLLVEQLGFRTVIWEDDWSLGLLIDDYLCTGEGDLDALVQEMSYGAWRNREVVEVLTWLRGYNLTHPHNRVHFVGAEHYGTRAFVYDRLSRYIAETAPELHAEAAGLIQALRPDPAKPIGEHAWWFFEEAGQEVQQTYLRRAARLRALVNRIHRPAGDRDYSLAYQTARQIEAFYTHYSLDETEIPSYRDAGSAQTIRWWLAHSGTRTAYWAAAPHTSRAAEVQLTAPAGTTAYAPVGSHLARWYGDRYRVIGFAFDHGTYPTNDGAITLPEPLPEWYERRFHDLTHEQSALDLRRRGAPGPVRDWLSAPFRTRGYPEAGEASSATGGTLAEWYDVVIHRHVVTPVDPYP